MIEIDSAQLDDGSHLVVLRHPELPGCYGVGKTNEEARESLARAREAYLDTLKQMGAEPPKPLVASSVSTTVETSISATSATVFAEQDGVHAGWLPEEDDEEMVAIL